MHMHAYTRICMYILSDFTYIRVSHVFLRSENNLESRFTRYIVCTGKK